MTHHHSWLDSAAGAVQCSAAVSSGLLPECWYPMKCFASPHVLTPQPGQPVAAEKKIIQALYVISSFPFFFLQIADDVKLSQKMLSLKCQS